MSTESALDHLLLELCQLAAVPIASGFSSPQKQENKRNANGESEIVTATDIAVSKLLSTHLISRGYSADQLLSEEELSTVSSASADSCWIIDPIDGTKEFAAGLEEFALSIAFFASGRIEGGAVFNPVSGAHVSGTRSQGLVKKSLGNAMKHKPRGEKVLLCSRSERQRGHFDGLSGAAELLPMGSIALKLALVAMGSAAATATYCPKNSWDVAAGILLVELAGGRLCDYDGNAIRFDSPRKKFEKGLLATAPGANHEEWLRLYQRHGRLER